jgi:hypothetical protein
MLNQSDGSRLRQLVLIMLLHLGMHRFERYASEPGTILLCIGALMRSITNSAGRFHLVTSLRKVMRISRSFLSAAPTRELLARPLKLPSFRDQRSWMQYRASTAAVLSNSTCVPTRRPPSTMISGRTVTHVTRSQRRKTPRSAWANWVQVRPLAAW